MRSKVAIWGVSLMFIVCMNAEAKLLKTLKQAGFAAATFCLGACASDSSLSANNTTRLPKQAGWVRPGTATSPSAYSTKLTVGADGAPLAWPFSSRSESGRERFAEYYQAQLPFIKADLSLFLVNMGWAEKNFGRLELRPEFDVSMNWHTFEDGGFAIALNFRLSPLGKQLLQTGKLDPKIRLAIPTRRPIHIGDWELSRAIEKAQLGT